MKESESRRRRISFSLATIVATAYTVGCTTVFWATLSKQHWFIRTCGVFTIILIMLPARAYEPIIFFVLVAAIMLVTICGLRFLQQRSDAASNEESCSSQASTYVRFHLVDCILATCVVGISLAIVLHLVEQKMRFEWLEINPHH